MQYDVVGLGVSTLDLIMVVDEFPGGELVQRAHRSLLQGGGPVATALVALARLGCRTAMIDRLGDDWRGRLILEEFRREGVSIDCISVAPGCSSSIATVLVRRLDAARTIVYSPGDAGELEPCEVPLEAIRGAKILHLNGRHLQAALAAARHARDHGVLVSFDGGAHRFAQELRPLIALCDICIVAREFALAFSGTDEVETAAAHLLSCGPSLAVVTAGTEGSWIFERTGSSFHQPAFPVADSVDTTGAGDAYHGGFLCGMVRGLGLVECARIASAVAALNTTGLGGRSALPSFQQAERFLECATRNCT